MIGETVASYKIARKLGEGGMGEVYLAEHKYIARSAAIKFLLRDSQQLVRAGRAASSPRRARRR